jgi:hypothetical protein
LKVKDHEIIILIKQKDVLENLLQCSGWPYKNILPAGHKGTRFSMLCGLARKTGEILKIALTQKPDLMVGTSVEITHVGALLRIPSIVVNEDDFDAVPLFSKLAYPLASNILAPSSCKVGKWQAKNLGYEGYHELAYLHPRYFVPDRSIVEPLANGGRYFLLRFANLNAHHDKGKSGIDFATAKRIIQLLEPCGHLYITSEKPLQPEFEKYRLRVEPKDVHHVLYYADIYIGDSQTMAAEAAVLGTPALRFNDFVGKLGYLEELEHKYGLTYGIKTSEPEKLYGRINEFLNTPGLKAEWQSRRQKMLSQKIDVTAFMSWIIDQYPNSARKLKRNPDYQYLFN